MNRAALAEPLDPWGYAPDGSDVRTISLEIRRPWQERFARVVADPTVQIVVVVLGRRAGKTTGLTDILGNSALEKRGSYFWGAPTYDIGNIGRKMFRQYFDPAVEHWRESMPPEAKLLNGSEVLWRSFDRAGGAIGRGLEIAAIEEAARVKKQVIFEDLFPTIMDTGGKLVAITTPRGQANWVYQWYLRAKAGEPGYAYIHGPSTENPTPQVRRFVEFARANMPESLFRQEIMAEFLEGEGSVFRNIAECACLEDYLDVPGTKTEETPYFDADDLLFDDDGEPSGWEIGGSKILVERPDGHYVVGCDIAKHVDYTVLYAMRIEDGQVHGTDRFHRLDWGTIKSRIVAFVKKWNAVCYLDATGIGDPIYDDIAGEISVVPYKFTSESKNALVVSLMTALEQREISFPNDDGLVAELESFEYESTPSGRFRYSAPEGMHDDRVMALALANWGRLRTSTGGIEWIA